MNHLKVWVDSSFRSKDNMCGCGFMFNDPITNKIIKRKTKPFYADNNNSAEILGIHKSITIIFKEYGIKSFIVYNDNVIAVTMLDSSKNISKNVLNKYPILKEIKTEMENNGIDIATIQVSRNTKQLKIVDKLGKEFRKNKYG